MISKREKKRIIALAEKGANYFDIAQAVFLSRAPYLLADLNTEVSDYLEGLVEEVVEEVLENEPK